MVCYILLLGRALSLPAQEFRATITGRITDAQNAVVSAAKVSVVQIGTEVIFETVPAADGLYTIPFLPPGNYRLTAEAPGFQALCPREHRRGRQ